ncbi:potassium-transporting ATPase subunit C [Mycobacterium sp. E740]|uniref:potassium-transporting ATPase subunit C n=1 Tax=Mycobacterium sp. E740 TaxID=1834149 RepID=UPI0007FE893D|nr:potassium-transporting ATPase subunit C [Mycobacterium sp. E740]OBI76209.1 K+-transporting ATPase subunit C [Mycobacterium sp. E740]
MKFSYVVRQHWAALRALLVLTVIVGIAYPVFVWLVAQSPGLRENANGSITVVDGKALGSRLIGQAFTDGQGNALPKYFQSRPSAAGAGYDPMASGASNLGPESIVDTPGKPSLLTLVCRRSAAVGQLEGVDGRRPFCTGGGVGAVLSVIGPRDSRGNVVTPTRVVSVNEPCTTTPTPFLNAYEGVRVECAKSQEDYGIGQIVPIRGDARVDPAVPADAVTSSGSGLDPHISIAYAELQVARVAKTRGVSADVVRRVVAEHTDARVLGFLGEPEVNVLELNIALDKLAAGG